MTLFLLVLGGGLGAVARYLMGKWMMSMFPSPPLPIAMLLVNVLGSLGLGMFLGMYYHAFPINDYDHLLYLFLGLGFFGAFTTFSTFSVETFQLFLEKEWGKALLYVTISILGSIFIFTLSFSLVIR